MCIYLETNILTIFQTFCGVQFPSLPILRLSLRFVTHREVFEPLNPGLSPRSRFYLSKSIAIVRLILQMSSGKVSNARCAGLSFAINALALTRHITAPTTRVLCGQTLQNQIGQPGAMNTPFRHRLRRDLVKEGLVKKMKKM